MLQAVADIWWPQIHRKIVLLAQTCNQWKDSGKNVKTLNPQSKIGKLPAAENFNDELAGDFAGPFKRAPKNKQYLLVAIDHKTGWPSATFTSQPGTEKVLNFLNEYIAQHGIAKNIRRTTPQYFAAKILKNFVQTTLLNTSNDRSTTTAETVKSNA